MKKLLTLALITLTTFANAKDITREELDALYVQYKDNYENITPGMTSEYKETSLYIFSEDGKEERKEKCDQYTKEVVISTDQIDKYLVYSKKIALNDCGGINKGQVDESLHLRDIDRVEQSEEGDKYVIQYETMKIEGNILTTTGNVLYLRTQNQYEFNNTRDLSKSQFYNLIQSKGEYTGTLLRRSHTDPTTINLEGIEFNDYGIAEND
jgi:hypothetical protein